jgi:hypothetical protein
MKGLKLYLIIGGVLLTLYIIAQFNRPKVIDWTPTLSSDAKTPFGTYILYTQLHDIFPNSQIKPYRQPIYGVIADDSIKQSSYVIICPEIEVSKPDYEQLIKYIKQGNDVFIAASDFGSLMTKNLDVETASLFSINNLYVPVNFLSPHLNPKKQYSVDDGVTNTYFTKFDTAKAIVLGENTQHKANFIKYTFGKGVLYLAANPKFFTNYSMLKPDGAAYSATALSFIKNTPQIIWDQYYTQGDGQAASPMRVFLTNPILQWAYYITLFSLIAFVVYEIKRRQRIIPVIEPLANSTLEFVNVIGQLYYEKRNNADIAHKKVTYFLAWLRDEYQLKTNKLDKEFIEKLSNKLEIDTTFAADLVSYLEYINTQTHISDAQLIQLNKFIDQFYKQSA